MTRTEAFKAALQGAYLRRSLATMGVIGTILNLINQGDALFGAANLNWFKFALTYLVPFCVATYASWGALSERAGPDALE